MVILTRLNNSVFALNPDLIELAESTPDTVLTLIDGTKYVVTESLSEVIAKIRWFRSSVIAQAGAIDGCTLDLSDEGSKSLTVVPRNLS